MITFTFVLLFCISTCFQNTKQNKVIYLFDIYFFRINLNTKIYDNPIRSRSYHRINIFTNTKGLKNTDLTAKLILFFKCFEEYVFHKSNTSYNIILNKNKNLLRGQREVVYK